jgi:Ni/Co efflux regulator RcnB
MTLLRIYRLALVLMTVALVAVTLAYMDQKNETLRMHRMVDKMLVWHRANNAARQKEVDTLKARSNRWEAAAREGWEKGNHALKLYREELNTYTPVFSVAQHDTPKALACLQRNHVAWLLNGQQEIDVLEVSRFHTALVKAILIEDAEKFGYPFRLLETKTP